MDDCATDATLITIQEAWGWTAWRRWSQMTERERRDGNYYYVEEFKLLLQQPQQLQQQQQQQQREHAILPPPSQQQGSGVALPPQPPLPLSPSTMLLPPGVTEVQVVADFLSELRGYIFKHLARTAAAAAAAGTGTGTTTALDPTAIAWCLTVPAMWGEAAKAKMRQAANRAGMARASDPGSLSMVLEPEAAAAAAVMHQHQRSARRSSGGGGGGGGGGSVAASACTPPAAATAAKVSHGPLSAADGDAADAATAAELTEVLPPPLTTDVVGSSSRGGSGDSGGGGDGGGGFGARGVVSSSSAAMLRDGDVLLVLDCGGGTADITMHRVVGSGRGVRLQEAAAGKGVLAGGRYVDEALWRHLRAMVGPSAWDTWQQQHPAEWMETATEWEAAKRQPRGPLSLQLRPNLMDLATAMHTPPPPPRPAAAAAAAADSPTLTAVADAAAAVDSAVDTGLTAAADWGPLPADGSVMFSEEFLKTKVYGPVVDQILAAARDVMDQGHAVGSPCSKMLLAGGLANSPYVQQRVRQLAQERRVPLLMPRQPQALVVSGAVLFGQYPSLVTARRARQTYGISCRALWTSEDAASHAAFGYPLKLWKEEDREYVADGVFELFVRRNQLIQPDEVVRRTFCPTSKSTTAVGIDLYATDSEVACYVAEPGMRKMATVTMELPQGWTSTVQRRQDYDIEVELRFGGTEITLFARDPRTNNAVATSTKWTPEEVWVKMQPPAPAAAGIGIGSGSGGG